MVRHLPVLIVVVPLLGGILAIFSGGGRKPWMWASAVSAAVAAISAALLAAVLAAPEKVLSYAIGSWPAPWGIEYRVDPLGACVLLVVSVIAAVVTFYSRRSVSDEIPGDRQNFFYSLWLLAVTGLLGITVTGDAFNVYVLLEISSLTIYALVAMGKDRDRRALPAAINYLILGSIGASFILLGIGYLYMVTGTLNMMDMRERLVAMQDSRTVIAGFAFIMVGLYMKMALFPLHVWLPNAYTYAPSAVRALLAATATKVGIYMAFRFTYTIFGIDFSFVHAPNSVIFIACAGLAIIFGSSCAIRQTNLARLLAYSSVAQIGYIVAGLALVNIDGVSGAVLHIMNHAMIKGGLFLAVGAIAFRLKVTDLRQLSGLAQRMPWTMAAFTAGGLGLIGVPLTAGFISKWYLVSGALKAGHWPIALVILAGSILAGIYVWRVVEIVYLRPPADDLGDVREAPLSMLIPTWILIGASIYFGIDATLTTGLAREAAETLLWSTP